MAPKTDNAKMFAMEVQSCLRGRTLLFVNQLAARHHQQLVN